MSIHDIIDILKAIFTGRDGVETILGNPAALLIVFALALLPISGSLVRVQKFGWAAATFTFAAVLGGVFYLNHGSKAGTVREPPPQVVQATFDLHPGKVLILGDLFPPATQRERTTLEACQARCAHDGQCRAFTFDREQQICYMKATVTALHTFAAGTSGIKRGLATQARK
jgi:hypothetical protein